MYVLVSTETGFTCKQSLYLCTYGGAPTVTNSFLIVFFCRLPSRVPPPPPRSPSARPARWSPSRGTSAARTPSASTSPRTSSGPSAGWGTRRRTRQSAASTGRYATKVTRFPHLFFKKKKHTFWIWIRFPFIAQPIGWCGSWWAPWRGWWPSSSRSFSSCGGMHTGSWDMGCLMSVFLSFRLWCFFPGICLFCF